MDEIDRLLTKLANEQPPRDLSQRIQDNFHRRYYYRLTTQLIVSGIMVAVGCWLFIPWAASTAGQINWSDNGLPVLQSLAAMSDMGGVVNTTWRSAFQMQTALSGSIGIDQWLGLMALGVGAWLGLSALLPGKTGW